MSEESPPSPAGLGFKAPVGIPPRNKRSLSWPAVPVKELRTQAWVQFRPKRDTSISKPLADLQASDLLDLYPAREPANYKGRRPTTGAFWSSTMQDIVLYESLLERETVMMADFDQRVLQIVSQPFRLTALVGGKIRTHTPDYALLGIDAAVDVVNCKPEHLLTDPKVEELHAWVHRAISQAGLRHRVVSELPQPRSTNLAFLSHMRNPRWRSGLPLDVVAAAAETPVTIDALVKAMAPDLAPEISLSCVRALLWLQILVTDLDTALSGASIVRLSDA